MGAEPARVVEFCDMTLSLRNAAAVLVARRSAAGATGLVCLSCGGSAVARKPTAPAHQQPSTGSVSSLGPRVSHPLAGASARIWHLPCRAGSPALVIRFCG